MPQHNREAFSSVLSLHQIMAEVRLGVGEEERKQPQKVLIDVRFYLSQPPTSAASDHGEYICYHDIGEKIHALCVEKEYRLIEYLVHEIYRLLRKQVPEHVRLWVKLRKTHILLPYVQGGSSYTYTDLPEGAWVTPE